MSSETSRLLAAALVITACAGQAAPPVPSSQPRNDPSRVDAEDVGDEAHLFPPLARPWTVADYVTARDVLASLAPGEADRMPSADGPLVGVFEKLSNLDEVSRVARSITEFDDVMLLGEAFATVLKLYSARASQGDDCGTELVAVAAANLRISAIQVETLGKLRNLRPDALRDDPGRLDGVMRMRFGLALSFAGVLNLPLETPRIVDAGTATRLLSPVIQDVAAFLLPEEDALVRNILLHLRVAGGDLQALEAMERALDQARERHPLVTAFLDEHRAFTTEQHAIFQSAVRSMLAPLRLATEPGGDRYAFPDREFSAVFEGTPVASQQELTGEDGTKVTVRTLGIRDAVRFARVVACTTRADPDAGGGVRDGGAGILRAMGVVEPGTRRRGGHGRERPHGSNDSGRSHRCRPLPHHGGVFISYGRRASAASTRIPEVRENRRPNGGSHHRRVAPKIGLRGCGRPAHPGGSVCFRPSSPSCATRHSRQGLSAG